MPKRWVSSDLLPKFFCCILLFFYLETGIAAAQEFFSDQPGNHLLQDLEIAGYWDKKLRERFPLTFNHLLSTGYFTTPSARMGEAGEVALGGASVPPYTHWNIRIQPFDNFELSANYRIFRGVKDYHLSPHGFGNYADRGANIKWAFIRGEETGYDFPGIALGIEDFMGSKKFTNYFIVGTHVFTSSHMEISLGWGTGRYTKGPSRGFFGGFAYYPLLECENSLFQGMALAAEYDPIDYTNPAREPHPHGRESHFPVNLGLKYAWNKALDLSASYIRGKAWAFSGSLNCNLGNLTGFFPKVEDPPLYCSPQDWEPLGPLRPEKVMIHSLAYALEEQGFLLTKAWLKEGSLFLSIVNNCYREERQFKRRLEAILASLTPSDISCIVIIIESYGMSCQQYTYLRNTLQRYAEKKMGDFEFAVLTPRRNVTSFETNIEDRIFYRRLDFWKWRLNPRVETFFGSAKGKVKYDAGITAGVEGFLPQDIYYNCQISYTPFSNIHSIADFDIFSPSQLPNVLTDYINYRKLGSFSTDQAFIQKHWNWNGGLFSKISLGYFQVNYAGIAGECLWYPAQLNVALGIEGALLKKRNYTGWGFQSSLRRLKGFTPTFEPYSILSQYFLNFYVDIPEISVASKFSVGGFLAYDKGARLEVTRYFKSGLRLTGWITVTNAQDKMHEKNFYNRGIAIEIPLDLFSRCSSRRVWNYGMAAWLRDAGATTSTGIALFDILNKERRN